MQGRKYFCQDADNDYMEVANEGNQLVIGIREKVTNWITLDRVQVVNLAKLLQTFLDENLEDRQLWEDI